MKKLIVLIAFVVSLKGFSQDRYSENNIIQITDKGPFNKTFSSYQTFNLYSKYNLKAVNFRSKQDHKFITSKVNKYHFAVFEKDIELTQAICLKVEFQMDKYKNKIALLNVHIPLKI